MTTKKRLGFILLLEHVHTMEELTDEEFGQFVRAYAAYVENGTEPEFSDRSMRMMWKTMKAFDEINQQKYSKTSEARQEAGRKGAQERWKNRDANSKNSKCHFANNKNSLSESESESESGSESSSSKEDSSCETTTMTTTESLEFEFRTNIGKLSANGKAELMGYAERMGDELVREIIRKCGDAGGRSWVYVRKALIEAETQGIKTAEEYRLTHPSGAGLNQRVDRKDPSGNDWLKDRNLEQQLKRLKKKEVPDVPQS